MPSAERARRDTYLGVAALLLAVGCLIGLSGWPKVVGFALAAAGFLGPVRRRRKLLRIAALALAVGLAWLYTVRTLQAFGLFGDAFGEGRMSLGHALAILFYLPTFVGVVLAFWAFAPRHDHERRERWLGWGASAVAAGGVVAFLYYALPWEITDGIIPSDWARAVRLGDLFFWTLALSTAAWAFFRSAGEAASPARSRVARRDGLLALASVWLALSYGCTLVEVFPAYFSGIGEDMVFYFDFTMVLRALGELAVILGAVFAAVAFGRSRRSLTDLCASLPGAAPTSD